MADNILQVILKAIKQGTGFKDTEKEALSFMQTANKVAESYKRVEEAGDKAGKSAKKYGNDLGDIKKALVGLGLAKFARQAYDAAAALDEAGRAGKDARNAFEAQFNSAKEAAAALELAKEATKGMVDESTLMINTALLLDKGLASNAQEAAELASATSALVAKYESLGASEAVITKLLSGGSEVLFDNIGLTKQQVTVRAEQIQATQGLAAEEAKMLAIRQLVIEQGQKAAATLSDETIAAQQAAAAGENLAGVWGELVADAFADARESGTGLVEALTALGQGILDQSNKARDVQQSLIATSDTYEEYKSRIQEAARANGVMHTALAISAADFEKQKKAALEAGKAAANAARSFVHQQNMARAAPRLSEEAAKAAREEARARRELNEELAEEAGLREAIFLKESRGGREDASRHRAEQRQKEKEEEEEAAKEAAEEMQKAFESAADKMASAIEGKVTTAFDRLAEVSPRFAEMFGGGEDPGEFARRLEALADGVQDSDQVFLDAFKQQAGGNPVFAALLQSIEEGDNAAIAEEANRLMGENLAHVLAVGIANQMRSELEQQNLLEEANRIVAEQLGQEPIGAAVDFVATAAGDTTEATRQVEEGISGVGVTAEQVADQTKESFETMVEGMEMFVQKTLEAAEVLGVVEEALRRIGRLSGALPGPAGGTNGAGGQAALDSKSPPQGL